MSPFPPIQEARKESKQEKKAGESDPLSVSLSPSPYCKILLLLLLTLHKILSSSGSVGGERNELKDIGSLAFHTELQCIFPQIKVLGGGDSNGHLMGINEPLKQIQSSVDFM